MLFTYTHTHIYIYYINEKYSKKTLEPKEKLMTHQHFRLYFTNVAPRMLAVENLRMSYRVFISPQIQSSKFSSAWHLFAAGFRTSAQCGSPPGDALLGEEPAKHPRNRDAAGVNIVDQIK